MLNPTKLILPVLIAILAPAVVAGGAYVFSAIEARGASRVEIDNLRRVINDQHELSERQKRRAREAAELSNQATMRLQNELQKSKQHIEQIGAAVAETGCNLDCELPSVFFEWVHSREN